MNKENTTKNDLPDREGGKNFPRTPYGLILQLRNRYFALMDVCLLMVIPVLALTLRVNLPWEQSYFQALLIFTLLALLVKLPLFFAFRLYSRYWRYASMDELTAIVLAVGISSALVSALTYLGQGLNWFGGASLPRSLPIIDGLLTLFFVGGMRFSVRAAEYWWARGFNRSQRKRVLIAGAGDAGEKIVREMLTSSKVFLEPVGFVDDDRLKKRVVIHGVRVLGNVSQIPELVAEYRVQEVIIAMPTASGKVMREIVALCEQGGVACRSIPGIYELLDGRISVSRIRKVNIEDLLRREPVRVDAEKVRQMVAGKRVLVSGAGGSIGGELCLQIARFQPGQLIALGHGENSLFTLSYRVSRVIAKENRDNAFDLKTVLADVRDRPRLESIFARYRPEIVFHAAAHKHVPLMEENVEDAITNNVLGTRNLVELALQGDSERFVLISSDKAVNPVSVMGMTKRLAELIVYDAAQQSGRSFVSVRFGNVLGSRGSVVPHFQTQIADGGPVTVTHADMERYFMTIPEAAQLVLQASVLGKNGEVFVLDMGEPVKIMDLARDLIELSGYRVGHDIDIVITGLRPGEKLHEELFSSDEALAPTGHNKILVVSSGASSSPRRLHVDVEALLSLAKSGETQQARAKLQGMVAPLTPPIPVLRSPRRGSEVEGFE